MMFGQLFPGPTACSDSNGPRPERPSAGNIAWGIANDIDLIGREFTAVLLLGPGARERAELVTIVMIVGKGAKLEEVPNPVMAKFQLGTARNIASQKRQDNMLPGF